jgi:peptidoglycan/LPS O-acetylase OafA/YrhL
MDLAFVSGMIAMGYAVCAVFFLRFWRRTKDSLFLVFAIAFLLLTLNQAMATLLGLPLEERSWLYLLRLAAFLIIIVAIVRKNLSR